MGLNALTVDLEEWFHICGGGEQVAPANWPRLPSRVVPNTERLLDLFDRRQVRATFFVLGYVAECHPDLVRRIAGAGHEIGSHGSRHDRAYDLGPDAFAKDLDASVEAIRVCGVDAVSIYRAPEWSINDRSLWALDVLAARGFRVDSSMAPMRRVGSPEYAREVHTRHTASGPIIECPPAVVRRFGQHIPFGGGWGLRMSRPAQVTRAVEARNRRGQSTVFWVHPWEVDDDPPRVRLSWPLWMAHYFCLTGFGGRLAEILADTMVGPLGELDRVSAPE
jgi:polysaccharide deacetylase family protein (PEP-CTERM system associated)